MLLNSNLCHACNVRWHKLMTAWNSCLKTAEFGSVRKALQAYGLYNNWIVRSLKLLPFVNYVVLRSRGQRFMLQCYRQLVYCAGHPGNGRFAM